MISPYGKNIEKKNTHTHTVMPSDTESWSARDYWSNSYEFNFYRCARSQICWDCSLTSSIQVNSTLTFPTPIPLRYEETSLEMTPQCKFPHPAVFIHIKVNIHHTGQSGSLPSLSCCLFLTMINCAINSWPLISTKSQQFFANFFSHQNKTKEIHLSGFCKYFQLD